MLEYVRKLYAQDSTRQKPTPESRMDTNKYTILKLSYELSKYVKSQIDHK